jgi:subfamily B ATP-binding cassette protein MsbA
VLDRIDLKIFHMATLDRSCRPSGAGIKRPSVSLIPRFYEVTGGSILLDGNDVRDYTLESLRNNIGIVCSGCIYVQQQIQRQYRLRQA